MARMLVDPVLAKARWLDYDGADGLSVAQRIDVKNGVALLIKRILKVDFTPAAGNTSTTGAIETVACAGCKVGDVVIVSPKTTITAGIKYAGFVATDGTISVAISATTGTPAKDVALSIVVIGLS